MVGGADAGNAGNGAVGAGLAGPENSPFLNL